MSVRAAGLDGKLPESYTTIAATTVALLAFATLCMVSANVTVDREKTSSFFGNATAVKLSSI